MASLLGQFFTSIKGSQEDIASKSLAYILEKKKKKKNVINNIIKSKTNLTFENIRYITQSVGKNKERPDISGIDIHGNERIIIETKFWSSLTDNQPIAYLNRLKEQAVLIFICPKLRELSLLGEIEIKIQHSNITYKNNSGLEVEGNKYIFVINWQSILEMIKQTLIENNEIKLVSDIDQIIGFCEIIDSNTFLPIQDYDLSPSTAKRISSYYDLLDKIYDKLQKEINAYKGKLQSRGQRFGYTIYFMINDYCIALELHFSFWQKIADTPFWIAIRPEWEKPQPVDFRDKLKKISAKTNIKIYENDFNDLLYFALKPKLNEVEDVVIDDIVRQIIMIMGEL
jgi:ribosome-associated translation inhibitor RaiA